MTREHPAEPRPQPRLRLIRWAPAVALASALALGLRYLIQGTGNVYTDTGRRFWVEDPLIGWTMTEETWFWVGLELLAVITAVAIGAAVAGLLAKRSLDRAAAGRLKPGLARVTVVAAGLGAILCVLTPVVPIVAFASGTPPEGAQALLPQAGERGDGDDHEALGSGPALPGVASGAYAVAPHRANLVVAQIAAGGETFDARFAPVEGEAHIDVDDLSTARARLSVEVASIDTGIPLRSTHARRDLAADEHPRITLAVDSLADLRRVGPGEIRFSAQGRVTLMGQELELPISGSIRALDAEEAASLDLDEAGVILVNANTTIPLHATPLVADDFDRDVIDLTARFVLVPTGP